jgi:hypothetical protein
MIRAWVQYKFGGRCLLFAILLGVFVTLAAAQQSPKPHPSSGPHQIILPPISVAGAQATLAVLDSQGRLLPGVGVELSGDQKVTTDATGRALFQAPGEPGLLAAKISGQGITASASVAPSEDSGPHGAPAAGQGEVKVISYPHVVAIHDRFTLEGSGFRGAADLNHVSLNGDPCLVVASSPNSLVVLPGPRVPVGDVTLHLVVGGMDAGQFPVSTVLLEISGPAEAPDAGSTGKLILHARGTMEPLTVEIRNASSGIIQLSKGNVQRVKTSGGEENIATVEVKFLTGGNYTISARLLSAD